MTEQEQTQRGKVPCVRIEIPDNPTKGKERFMNWPVFCAGIKKFADLVSSPHPEVVLYEYSGDTVEIPQSHFGFELRHSVTAEELTEDPTSHVIIEDGGNNAE